MANQPPCQHFLIITLPVQSHINPARQLAYRLFSLIPSCHVTFSTAISSHRLMFPSLSSPDQETTDHHVSFIPYSDGYDSGFDPSIHNYTDKKIKSHTIASNSLSEILSRLKAGNRPVTCIIHTLFLSWVHDVARANSLPTILYWIQPATALSIYYHYFHGFDSVISSLKHDQDSAISLPGLIPLKIRDLPSFVPSDSSDHLSAYILNEFKEMFEHLDYQAKNTNSKPRILINTFEDLEADVLESMEKHLKLYAVGPMIQSSGNEDQEKKNIDESERINQTEYMKWLDTMPERSTAYVSFGSVTVVTKRQLEEIQSGLKDSGLPYLWVVRKDSRVGLELKLEDSSNSMIVEWCDQVKVLSHPSMGCFLTHHGWNSTIESIMCGVPMVGVPQWSDQPTNAKLAEQIGIGVRGGVSEDGVVLGGEINRCLQMVMRDSEMRKNAAVWRDKLKEAMKSGGSSEINLLTFVNNVDKVNNE